MLNKNLKFILLLFLCAPFISNGQEVSINLDSNIVIKETHAKEKKEIAPQKIAALRSALLPGFGQIYNKKYWKLPIVYGALGTTAFVFANNLNTYKDLRLAFKVKYFIRVHKDSTDYYKVDTNLLPLSEESLRFNRDQFRRSLDYTALLFVALWGLNVIDAAVDAHLKSFDVSRDLSLKIKPGFSEFSNTHGLSITLAIH